MIDLPKLEELKQRCFASEPLLADEYRPMLDTIDALLKMKEAMDRLEQFCRRLAEIRTNIEKHRAMGWDVEDWESAFLLDVLDQILKSSRFDLPSTFDKR